MILDLLYFSSVCTARAAVDHARPGRNLRTSEAGSFNTPAIRSCRASTGNTDTWRYIRHDLPILPRCAKTCGSRRLGKVADHFELSIDINQTGAL